MGRNHKIPGSTRRRIAFLHARGERFVDLSRQFGVSTSTIGRICREAGVHPPRRRLPVSTMEQIIRRYLAGECLGSIARDLGFTVERLTNQVRACSAFVFYTPPPEFICHFHSGEPSTSSPPSSSATESPQTRLRSASRVGGFTTRSRTNGGT